MEFTKISKNIFTIENFLSEEECKGWVNFTEIKGFEDAKVNMGFIGQVVDKSVRNNERIIYDSFDVADKLWKRLKPYAPQRKADKSAYALNERLRFYKYNVGQQFRPHKDGSFYRSFDEWSEYTFMIYLNEDMEGGETKFERYSIKPKTGMALIFLHDLLHEGCPVTKGVKYVLRTDIMYKKETILNLK